MKIWGKIVTKNKIIKDMAASSDEDGTYQDNLKNCINEICRNFDIETPYWLPANVDEYNARRKTSFTKDNFIDEFSYDKFVIEEIDRKD